MDVLRHLSRKDKWFLGGAPALLYAPPAPIWLDRPGFWDEAHYLHFPIQPVFTFSLLDEHGKEVPLHFTARHWRPDRLEQSYTAGGLEVVETKACGPEDVLTSVLKVTNGTPHTRALQLLLWTAQPVTDEGLEQAGHQEGSLLIRRSVQGLRQTQLSLTLALSLEGARSWSVDLAETTANHPNFFLTPYYETLTPEGLGNAATLTGVNRNGLVYAAMERSLHVRPGETVLVRAHASVAADTPAALQQLQDAWRSDPLERSERAWRDYFDSVPAFSCSDPYLQTYYWYRWYGLRLNTLNVRLGNYHYPAVAEGIGYFRVPISYSAQCHMLETRWLEDASLAQGSMLNFLENQRSDGSLPNHIHVNAIAPEGIYHADWGARILDLHRVHPDPGFLERAFAGLERYARYFYRERDREGTGLYDHINQWESGQEYMSRYVWVDDEGDDWKPMKRRLKGLDASVYIYRLERALAEMSRILGKGEDAGWDARAERTRSAILRQAWNEELEAFVDLSPELEPSRLVLAVSFYPFFTDLAGPEHLVSIYRYLLSPDHFWTRYPVPASPKSDPYYSATPAWRGKRTNCPWNGRTWPMTNSHIAEALAHASRLDAALRPRTAEFIHKFVRMMFFDGDAARPNCFEHYNPETGKPSVYRGIDDYQHSWVVDLIIKYVAGVQPETDCVRVDPFPFELESFSLRGVNVRGHRLEVVKDEAGYRVYLDRKLVHESEKPEEVTLAV